jgi:hypothetical protein
MIEQDGLSDEQAARLARVRECLHADRPSEEEIARARQRWRHAVKPKARVVRAPLLLTLAGLFAAAGAVAAGAIELTANQPARPTPSVAPRMGPVPDRAQLPDHAQRARPAPARAVPEALANPAPEPSARPAMARDQLMLAPAPPSAPTTEQSPAPAVARFDSTTEVELEANPRSDATAPSDAWQRAADALRRQDDREASRALGELGHSPDPLTRDSAALAEAQLDARAGRWSRALPALQRLATAGATPLIRRRAREMLAERR